MANPTLSLTFADHLIRVAEFLGIVEYDSDTGVAIVPTDAHNLDVCKRLVNDGWRRFYNSQPKWNWMRPRFSIIFNPDGTTEGSSTVIDGDDARYYMPDGFYGHVIGQITYDGSNPQVGITLVPTTDSHIRQLYAANGNTTGIPSLSSFRPLNEKGKQQWEMVVWPRPAGAYTILGTIRIYPNKMTESTDRPNAGFEFDEAIQAACLYEAELQREDNSRGPKKDQWDDALVRAIRLDTRTAPRNLGYNGNGNTYAASRSWYRGVDSYGGVAIDDPE
jgi:hypothetical protein